MPFTLYDAAVPVYLRYLERMLGLIDQAQSQAPALGLTEAAVLAARAAPDMLPFETQVVIVANFALRGSFPLAGAPVPPYGDYPSSFEGLRARIERARDLLRGLEPGAFDGAEQRQIEDSAGDATLSLPGAEFLCQYALPNFFFHFTTAYVILRGLGCAVGKAQFDGYHSYPTGLE